MGSFRALLLPLAVFVVALTGCSLLLTERTFRDPDGGSPDGSLMGDAGEPRDGGSTMDGGPVDASVDGAVPDGSPDMDGGDFGPCNPSPCHNGGRCTVLGASFACDCTMTGYDGPTCDTPIVCEGAMAPENGQVSRTSAPYPETVTYSCDVDHVLEGSATSQCTVDGTFSTPPPVCRPNFCPTLPSPVSGSVMVSGVRIGDTATYSCEPGRTLVGGATRTCEIGGVWSGSPPSCRVCTSERWCWENPSPVGTKLAGVWGTSRTNVWAVGDGGVAIRWNGAAWTGTTTPTARHLRAVWGSSATSVWAVGDAGTIIRWNGSVWSLADSGTTSDLLDVWGTSATNVWAVGAGGTIRRWNGTSWAAVVSGTTRELAGVWASSAADAWAVGDEGTILRWNGTAWSAVSGATNRLRSVRGRSATESYAVGDDRAYRWDGASWMQVAGGGSMRAVWSSSGSEVWAVGSPNGIVWRSVGGGFDLHRYRPNSGDLLGVWGAATDDVWAVGDIGEILHWDGASWTRFTANLIEDPYAGPLAAHARTGADVWVACTGGTVAHWDGREWSRVETGRSTDYFAVWASASHDVWVAGVAGEMVHWNGTTWRPVLSGTARWLRSMWGGAPDDVWAVGDVGTIIHWNGSAWSVVPSGTTNTLNAIWGSAPDDVWAVGNGGTTLRWDGSAWTSVPSGTSDFLLGVHGTSSTDVWAVGERASSGGAVLRWNGVEWRAVVASAGARGYTGVWARSPTEAWVIGYDGVMARWDGASWSELPSSIGGHWSGITGVGADAWVVGEVSTILRYRP